MDLVERYLTLGLRLGRHVDGLVDAYYGPPELAAAVEREGLREGAALAVDADELIAELPGAGLGESRVAWIGDQLRGARIYAGILAGEKISYLDEVEGCYGVRPERVHEDAFLQTHRRLDELLPPLRGQSGGPLHERYDSWRKANAVPAELIVETMTAILAQLRERTAALVPLPADEEFALELVAGEPWAAFNYYLGGHRSRIVVNTDLPFSGAEIVHLAAHEGYPGHHTEHATKEALLLERLGHLEESLQLVPTPQALLSEGIAELGGELLIDDELEAEFARILRAAGVPYDPAEAAAIRAAREPLGYVSRNAALAIHENGVSVEDAQAYVERWALAPPKRAAHTIAFVTDPTWRAYVVTYTEGLRLARAYVGGDLDRFRRLVTEPVRVSELRATAEDGAAVSSGP
ncbi:MAG: DUF885 domain-containing protein [Gaiellaceae bacterium MAG52_C11]|nr:DUF885 domain-containing protein [Candidatus Gaiellasilicea maunaloa]